MEFTPIIYKKNPNGLPANGGTSVNTVHHSTPYAIPQPEFHNPEP